ncbi:cellulose-binding domain-containing protein [Micromonospora sp. NPDC048839]|uniref:cellulose-binding domain-containing protein n=1 Tax=Micromonospora sp. NPDC048839 TaxID=3155641 RepID=UPI00340922CC
MTILRARPASTLAVVAALAAATAAGTALLTGPATAAQGCRVDYTPNQWPGGFTANIKVALGDTAVSRWTVTWMYAGDERVTNGWNATVTQSGSTVTARNMSYNGSIPAGGSTELGVQGTLGSSGGVPTGFSLNGVPCNGAGPTPTTAPPTTAPPTTAPSTTVPPTGCAGAVLCDGFENQTGSTPSGDWTVVSPDCSGAGTSIIGTATAHSGSRAVRINGAAGYCNHVFIRSTKNLSSLGSVRYGRIWVRHTTAQPTPRPGTMLSEQSCHGLTSNVDVDGAISPWRPHPELRGMTLPTGECSPVAAQPSVYSSA